MYDDKIACGSEWLKWDCHIHTPFSYENEYNTDFDQFIKDLKTAAIEYKTDVVVINDYFTIEGYKKIIEKYCNKDDENQSYYIPLEADKRLYVLPGIELRINNFTDNNSAVNVHVFFNQKLKVETIEEHFINKLEISTNGHKLELKEKNMIKLGVAISSEEDYRESLDIDSFTEDEKNKYKNIAFKSISLKYDDLINTKEELESLFSNDTNLANNCALIVIPFKGHGSVGEVGEKIWDGRSGEIKKDILSSADICFATNKKDIDFLLGKTAGADSAKIKMLFNSIKPCIWGSDAHKKESLCHPSNGNSYNYTWIKALPSFDGIKQIIFEPEYRVRIQEEKPEKKIDYRVIDKVRYVEKGDNKTYPIKSIYLNQNLNTVIGGKSSGKSFLLNNIATAVNGSEVSEQYSKLKTKFPYDFEVYWKDGSVDKLSSLEQRNRKVKYINQMYITQFVNNADKLDEEVFSILLENENVSKLKSNFDSKKKSIDDKINQDIFELDSKIKEISIIYNKVRDIGDYKSIQTENNKLLEKREEIIKASSMTEEQMKYYTTQLLSKEGLNKDIEEIQHVYVELIDKHKVCLKSIKTKIDSYLNKLNVINDVHNTSQCYREVYTGISNEIENGLIKLESKKNEHIKDIEKKKAQIIKIDEILVPYKNKVSQKNIIDSISEDIKKQQQLLKDLSVLNEEYKTKCDDIEKIVDDLSKNLSERYNNYIAFINNFKENNFINMGDDVSISCVVDIENKKLSDQITDILNRNNLNNKPLLRRIEDRNILGEDMTDLIEIIKNSINNKYICKSSYNRLDLIRTFTNDYFKFKFDIISQDTSFFDMSPGKQGLLLLKLILHMSNETYPILLDQPEDNLDNRTISSELKDFIKNKKINRQIVMVTHNANLAVLTDSEEIIVANQRGRDESEQETLFDYVTGAMEYSFSNKDESKVLYKQGIREHLCEILEGGVQAFKSRENKYEINRMVNK